MLLLLLLWGCGLVIVVVIVEVHGFGGLVLLGEEGFPGCGGSGKEGHG